jgi:hypothetical protein
VETRRGRADRTAVMAPRMRVDGRGREEERAGRAREGGELARRWGPAASLTCGVAHLAKGRSGRVGSGWDWTGSGRPAAASERAGGLVLVAEDYDAWGPARMDGWIRYTRA